MRQRNPTARLRPPLIPRESTARLLRAVDELRALELQKHGARASTPTFDDLVRRVEAKAREVFQLAQDQALDRP